MDCNEYQRLALRTINKKSNEDELLMEGLIGISSESGECLDILSKHLYQGHAFDKDHLIRELGDVSWYLAQSAYALGVDLDTIFKINLDKIANRYPDGFDPDKSINRSVEDL